MKAVAEAVKMADAELGTLREALARKPHVSVATADDIRKLLDRINTADNRISELEAALLHAVEIAEDKRIGGTWDDLLQYRKLLNR